MRDFDVQDLYGNISGYIGLFLGYSLFQIPSFLRFLYRFIKGHVLTKINKQSNRKHMEHSAKRITIEKNVGRNIDDELKRFNLELHELSQKFQELHDLMRM